MTENTMTNQEKARQFRASGLHYQEIGRRMGVSATMARNYTLGITNRRPLDREFPPYACKKTGPQGNVACQRQAQHRGVHLANDEANRLICWE